MPTVFPPGDVTVLDRFDRANGDAWAGDGATLWDDVDLAGSPSLLQISDGKLVASGEGGGLTNESVADGIRMFTCTAGSSGYVMFFFRMSGGTGYALNMQGGTWLLYSVAAGEFTTIASQSVPNSLGPGIRVGIRFEGAQMTVCLGNALYMTPTPVMTVNDLANTGAGACGFRMSSTLWALDDYSAGGLTSPTSAVTLHVDPDHPDASDDYTRSEAASPDTPLMTAQQACWLARADTGWADTILVNVCEETVLNASLNDPYMQPQLDYRSLNRSLDAVGWPFGNNEGNETIVVRGNVDLDLDTATRDDVKTTTLPKIYRLGVRGLNNWRFERIQWGFDVGSGDDYDTLGAYERITDLEWKLCHFTGGLAIVQKWLGHFIVDRCVVHAPLHSPSASIHPGAGMRMEQAPGEAGEGSGLGIGQLLITDSEFSNIQGNDALMIGGLYLEEEWEELDEASDNIIRRTLFHNVTEGDPVFHTDSIQPLQCRRVEIDQCAFIGCSNALQVTDFRNGEMVVTRCLTVGVDIPLQIQGCDEVTFVHNTCIHPPGSINDLTFMFYSKASLPQATLATITNNIIGGIWMRDGQSMNTYFRNGSVISHNIILSNPGLTTNHGANLPGIAEFGISDRLNALPDDIVYYDDPVQRSWELANDPAGPGLGEGMDAGYDVDFFGRPYADPPDVGCFQSDPGTLVTPVARPPYLIARSPASDATGVSQSANVTATLYPVPGQQIDDSTVTSSSVYVTDPAGNTLPAIVTTAGPVDGGQVVTVDIKSSLSPETEGTLFPFVVYRVNLTGAIEDTEGSALLPTSWTFRAAGPGGAAVYPPGGEPEGHTFTVGRDWRFPVGTAMQLRRTTGDGRAKGPVIQEKTVQADGTCTFTGLETGVYYVAGPAADGPFTFFRVYV